jgi:hypothetical protein
LHDGRDLTRKKETHGMLCEVLETVEYVELNGLPSLATKGSGWCCMTIIYTNNDFFGTISGTAVMRPAQG